MSEQPGVTYPASEKRIVLRAQYEEALKRAEAAEARTASLDERLIIMVDESLENEGKILELEARAAELERGRDKWRETVNTYIVTKNPDLEYGAFKEICEMLGLDVMAQSRYQEEEDDYQDMLQQRDAAQAQVAQLREALKFYANDDDVIFRTDDGGKVALSALSAAPADTARAEYVKALEALADAVKNGDPNEISDVIEIATKLEAVKAAKAQP